MGGRLLSPMRDVDELAAIESVDETGGTLHHVIECG